MSKKNLALSALLLSQMLSPLTSPSALAAGQRQYDMDQMTFDTIEKEITFSAKALEAQNGKSYTVDLYLNKGSFMGMDYETKETALFDFEGSIVFKSKGPTKEEFYYPDSFDGDGNVVFQRVSSDDKKDVFKGFNCSSTFNGCAESADNELFELIHNKVENTWEMSFIGNLTGSYSDDGSLKVFKSIPLNAQEKESKK